MNPPTLARFYGYKHWTLEESPRCFYVGKGLKPRPFHRKKNERGRKWHAVVEQYGLRVEVCVGPVTNEEACVWEIEQIAIENTFSVNHHHHSGDVGCNFTRGGDGTVGLKRPDVSARQRLPRTDEYRKKMSEAMRGKSIGKGRKRTTVYKTRSDKGGHQRPRTKRLVTDNVV